MTALTDLPLSEYEMALVTLSLPWLWNGVQIGNIDTWWAFNSHIPVQDSHHLSNIQL